MRTNSCQLPLPDYAVSLLLAAKNICCSREAIYRSEENMRLSDAIERFENLMPMDSTGGILTVSENGREKP